LFSIKINYCFHDKNSLLFDRSKIRIKHVNLPLSVVFYDYVQWLSKFRVFCNFQVILYPFYLKNFEFWILKLNVICQIMLLKLFYDYKTINIFYITIFYNTHCRTLKYNTKEISRLVPNLPNTMIFIIMYNSKNIAFLTVSVLLKPFSWFALQSTKFSQTTH